MVSRTECLSMTTALQQRSGNKHPEEKATAENKGRAKSGVTSYEVHHRVSRTRRIASLIGGLGWLETESGLRLNR